jgi:hypothetical protein
VEDAADHFRRAAAFLRAEAGDAEGNICVLFALLLDLAAAAAVKDSGGWAAAARDIRRFLDNPLAAPLTACYLPAVDRLPATPDRGAAEDLLRLVPHF